MILKPNGLDKGHNMDSYVDYLEHVVKEGYTDFKGALFFTKAEYLLDDETTIKLAKEYARRHPDKVVIKGSRDKKSN